MLNKNTLVVNLFGGPSIGKSTNASLLFGKLKNAGITTEYVTEYAKELVWEERGSVLTFQPYIFCEQWWRQHRLLGKVEVIVTDSPLLLSIVYAQEFRSPTFVTYVRETFSRFDNFNLVLKRNKRAHAWNPGGRTQTEAEAGNIDASIREILNLCEVPFVEVPVLPGELTANDLFELVVRRLG